MKIVFLLRTGFIEYEIPPAQVAEFNFMQAAANVRMMGYFMGEAVYIRHSEIVGMSMVDGNAPSPFKPMGSTMQ